ncbi:NAD(P)H-dependent oxidoreductase [Facklamia miroungae]|uniref:Putative NADPH-quinone reductase (Modulator of drug activity B) n=1 Tax=Facklamia miroungae TaxID=120956 RepID=A0A1G7RQE3_9LACT|nr:NAD(P)H-dependent oxidoreductase [Facklamia miroungae]NKZ29317.1 NAD(P)H-dependent oxidoreductase [Facklamia miroungae]SDG12972.1 Putative NADPH-quinone reductase (modulator of drug activity B) [Facklamia miroungae]
MRVISYIAHDHLANSSSQQFLLASGKALTAIDYVDLTSEWHEKGSFKSSEELARLANYDRILFQFPLYWYQAPAILKIWMDQVFDDQLNIKQTQKILREKEFGIVLTVGSKRESFQPGERVGVTLSELLSPYYAWSNYFAMKYLPPFVISQFHYLTEAEKNNLLIDYVTYIKMGRINSLEDKVRVLLDELNRLELNLDPIDQLVFDQFIQKINEQADELKELKFLDEE